MVTGGERLIRSRNLHSLKLLFSRSCPLSWMVMPSNHLIPFCPLLLLPSIFPSIRVFYSESALPIRGQSIGALASASVLPMNIQGWFPLGSTDLMSLRSQGLKGVFSNTTVWKHQFFSAQLSLWSISLHDHWTNHSSDYMELCQQSNVSGYFPTDSLLVTKES